MKYLGLFFAAVLLSACNKQPVAASPMQGRLEAANSISEPNARNEALGKVAIDAANAKDMATTTKAIEGITLPALMNSTAATCALAFSRKADPKSATTIARLISEPNLRNSTLQSIATGQ
jgi:hypothetical protein